MDLTEWEALCHQCGECCFEKGVNEKGILVTTRISCRYLDITTRNCRVYHKRFDVGERCVKLTPELVKNADWLPDGCAYRQWVVKEQARVCG